MIRVQNLTKTFGEFTAVKDISFEVEPGEIFAFLGPNGAGKTTTIKMLTTLLRPTSGSIHLDGFDPWVKQREARQRFGIVFQDPSLDSEQTAYENMELHGVLYHVPHRVRAERIEHLLKLFELWERRNDYVKTFSGGMKRRLEIARGFLHTPKILFLDEPTLGLDPQSRNQLWMHVKGLNEREQTTVGPDERVFESRFQLPGSACMLELGWRDGRREIDRDTEIAVDLFCEHLAEALVRLSPALPATATQSAT